LPPLVFSTSLKACAERHCPPSPRVKGLADPQNVNCFRASKHIRGQTGTGGGAALGRWLGTVGSLSAQNDSFGTLAGNPYGRPGAKTS